MKTKDMIASLTDKTERPVFTPTRAAGLARLDLFAERAGDMYDRCRNYDLGPEQRANVSALSPWVRHRLITETCCIPFWNGTHLRRRSGLCMRSFGGRLSKDGWSSTRAFGRPTKRDCASRSRALIRACGACCGCVIGSVQCPWCCGHHTSSGPPQV